MSCWCCGDISERALGGREYGPPAWAGHCCRFIGEPTTVERREWLEACKKRLQERLADVDDELNKP